MDKQNTIEQSSNIEPPLNGNVSEELNNGIQVDSLTNEINEGLVTYEKSESLVNSNLVFGKSVETESTLGLLNNLPGIDRRSEDDLTIDDIRVKRPNASASNNSALNSLLIYSSSSEDEEEKVDDSSSCSLECDNSSSLKCTETIGDAQVKKTSNFQNSSVHYFGDLSLTFPRNQQVIDDEALELSSSSSDSSASLLFTVNSDLSDYDCDDDFELCNNNSTVNKNNETKDGESNASKVIAKKKNKQLITNGELTLDDLPAIDDLHISVPEDQCVVLGKIASIVDRLVVVQAIKDLPPLDLETVLFLEWDKPLGQVFDVFGPVVEPLYCVRFNSSEHIKMKDVSVGLPVYYVPKSNHTKYVFLTHLLNVKGSDASWEDNNEPPVEFLEYSDDEQERKAKQNLKKGLLKKNRKKDRCETTEPQKKKPTAYERQMNKRNLKISEMDKRRSYMNSNHNVHFIRPPSFFPPSVNNTAEFGYGSQALPNAEFQHSNYNTHKQLSSLASSFNNSIGNQFCSSAFTDFSVSQPFNRVKIEVPNTPPPYSPWSVAPHNHNPSTDGVSGQHPLNSNMFSSPPPNLPGFNNYASGFSFSQGATSCLPMNILSTPNPCFPSNNFISTRSFPSLGADRRNSQNLCTSIPPSFFPRSSTPSNFSLFSSPSNNNCGPFTSPPPSAGNNFIQNTNISQPFTNSLTYAPPPTHERLQYQGGIRQPFYNNTQRPRNPKPSPDNRFQN